MLYKYQDEDAQALDYFNRSLENYEAAGNSQKDIAIVLNNLAWVHQELGDIDKAMSYCKRSLQVSEEINAQQEIAGALNSLAGLAQSRGHSNQAIDYYFRSLNLYQASQDNAGSALLLYNIGNFYYAQGDLLKAIQYHQQSLDLAKEVGQLSYVRNAYESLYKSYKKGNQPTLALQMHEAYTAVQDSLRSDENQRAVIRQEYQYTYEQQAFADSLQNAEAQKLATAQLAAQKAQNLQQRQQAIFIGLGLLSLLLLSGFAFQRRRKVLQRQLQLEQQEAQRLKELDQFKAKLYTNLTHEFRTPLTVILGMAEKVRTEPKRFLNEGTHLIERNGNSLLRIINQLLDLSKLDNHSFSLQLQQSDIIAYLRYLTDSFHSYANGKNLSLRFFSNQEQLLMDHDPEQVKQIMTNLLSNAIKFTPAGGEVKVRVIKSDEHLSIEVKDDGIGIPQSALPHIFERFYQVDDSTTRAFEGTGIGLAHTKELVKLMEGEISVQSTPERGVAGETTGSIFAIKLPIRHQAPRLDHASWPPEEMAWSRLDASIPTPSRKDKPRSTILIVEDNPDVVIYLKSCLENDYQLEVAYNGSIGIEKAIATIPDLIISDVMMPGKDGFEVCDALKRDERTSHIPIVLLTAKADLSDRLVGLERGADAYLAKPFQREELLIRLQKLLEGRR
ncbi:MAG: ATP-binding protein, partial [Bacteroidota bacterium]